MNEQNKIREALIKIAEIANAATSNNTPLNKTDEATDFEVEPQAKSVSCTIKSVPKRLLKKAAENAVKINPVNAPVVGTSSELELAVSISDPQSLTVLTGKYWGPTPRVLTVSFMENTSPDLQARIVNHMNAWTKTACISFKATTGIGQVRISRRPGGYWSYLGTDVLLIPKNRPTMNLEGFSMNTPGRRV